MPRKPKQKPETTAPSGPTRSADVVRMCRLCAVPLFETDYPSDLDPKRDGWTCQGCTGSGVLPLLPLLKTGVGERYDTSMLFAGYRVFKVPEKGGRVEFETEVRSPAGVFYAAAEAAFAFECNNARMGNILRREFPEARLQSVGDDGVMVLVFPARLDLFRSVCRRVGAFKPRKVSQETKDRLAAAREAGNAARRAAVTQGTLL